MWSWKQFSAFVSFSLIFVLSPQLSGLVINEFVASNGSTIADEDGDFSDWIELYNPSESVVGLSGVGLSDNRNQPYKWRFPEVSIEPNGHLLVWASGKDRLSPTGELHANFAISAAGEELLLTSATGEIMDRVEPVALLRNQSYARTVDGDQSWGLTFEASPGATNVVLAEETLAAPVFSKPSGFFDNGFQLEIHSSHPDADILYTLDGSDPLETALSGSIYQYKNQYIQNPGEPDGELLRFFPRTLRYSDGIWIEGQPTAWLYLRNTTNANDPSYYIPPSPPYKGWVIRARAIADGFQPSPIVTRTYWPETDDMPPFGRAPAVNVTLPSASLFDYFSGIYTAGYFFDLWRRNNPDAPNDQWTGANYFQSGSLFERMGHIEIWDVDGSLMLDRAVGIRLHGGVSRRHPQKSLRIYSGDNYDKRGHLQADLFPSLEGRSTGLPLVNFQRLLLRNSGSDTAETHYRDALVQMVMEPLGLDTQAWRPVLHFLNGEFWGVINLRERIDRYTLADHHGIDERDVAMIEFTLQGEELDEGNPSDLDDFYRLRDFLYANSLVDDANYAVFADAVDVENFLLYHMANIYLKNTDWPGHNVRMWRNKQATRTVHSPSAHDGRWRFFVFDMDFAMAPAWGHENNHNTLEFALAEGGEDWPNPDWSTLFLRRLVQREDFRNRFIHAFADHWNTTFHPRRVVPLIDKVATELTELMEAHSGRWRDFSNQSALKYKEFTLNRRDYVREHLQSYFGIADWIQVSVDISDRNAGEIVLNTIKLRSGGSDPSVLVHREFPWRGEYAAGIPLEIEAIAFPGYKAVGWLMNGDFIAGSKLHLPFDDNVELVALYQKTPDRQLLKYWDFEEWDQQSTITFTHDEIPLTLETDASWSAVSDASRMSRKTLFNSDNKLQAMHEFNNSTVTAFSFSVNGSDEVVLTYDYSNRSSVRASHWITVSQRGEIPELVFASNFEPRVAEQVTSSKIKLNDYSALTPLTVRLHTVGGGSIWIDELAVWGRPVLTDSQQFAWQGISFGDHRFHSSSIGRINLSSADLRFIHSDEMGWLYVQAGAGGHSAYLYSYANADWLYLPDPAIPFGYDYRLQQWKRLPND